MTLKFSSLARTLALILALAWAGTAAANVEHNSETIGRYTVNFSAFNSAFVPPDIAALHNLVRASDQALINVSVLDNQTGKTVPVQLEGVARNLIQQAKPLKFKTIEEPDAVYYIAPVRHTDQEVMHFDLLVTLDGEAHKLKFTRKLWLEK